MKFFILLITIMMSTLFADAQYNWKICLNKKTVLISSEINEEANTKKVESADWVKKGYLEVTFKDSKTSGWLHSLQFSDELDNQLLVKDSTLTAKIPIDVLRKLYAGKKELKIYMMINPPNPMMAAPSRIIHLLTLRLPR